MSDDGVSVQVIISKINEAESIRLLIIVLNKAKPRYYRHLSANIRKNEKEIQ